MCLTSTKCNCSTGVRCERSQQGMDFVIKEGPSEEAFALFVPVTLSFFDQRPCGP